jgi:hypothetical protein
VEGGAAIGDILYFMLDGVQLVLRFLLVLPHLVADDAAQFRKGAHVLRVYFSALPVFMLFVLDLGVSCHLEAQPVAGPFPLLVPVLVDESLPHGSCETETVVETAGVSRFVVD